MKPQRTLRRWPTRNFLAELDTPQRDRYAIDDLARREPRIRRAQRLVRAAARSVEARVHGPDWIRYRDAAMTLQLAIFEVAFNLGYENGLIARTSATPGDHGTSEQNAERTLHLELRRALAHAPLRSDRAARVVLEIALGLIGVGDP
jgi:hypothetical protein